MLKEPSVVLSGADDSESDSGSRDKFPVKISTGTTKTRTLGFSDLDL